MPTTWIVLLRAVNVSGKNLLKMEDLRNALSHIGFPSPRTYIQSGNILFKTDLSFEQANTRFHQLLEDEFAITTISIWLQKNELDSIIADCPYSSEKIPLKHIHTYLSNDSISHAQIQDMNALKAPNESYIIHDKWAYLHAPDGSGRSKLAAKFEKLLGVETTARNLNTLRKLQAMVANL